MIEYKWLLHSTSPATLTASTIPKTNIASLTSSDTTWVIDLSVSSHMTSNHVSFTSLSTGGSHSPAYIAKGSLVPVHRMGTTQLTSQITLHNVLYVPHLLANLLYICAFITNWNSTITFFPVSLYFSKPQNEDNDWWEPRRGSVYVFTTFFSLPRPLSSIQPSLVGLVIFPQSVYNTF